MEPKIEVRGNGSELWIGDLKFAVFVYGNISFPGCMLQPQQLAALLPYLQTFAETGRFDKPAEKTYRDYTPVEAAVHLGRELLYQNRYYYLHAVLADSVNLSPTDVGTYPELNYHEFCALCRWRDTNELCGVAVT
jgi:hypothetical protein